MRHGKARGKGGWAARVRALCEVAAVLPAGQVAGKEVGAPPRGHRPHSYPFRGQLPASAQGPQRQGGGTEGLSSPRLDGFMEETTDRFFKLFSSPRKPLLSEGARWQKWRRAWLGQGLVLGCCIHRGLLAVGTFQLALPGTL